MYKKSIKLLKLIAQSISAFILSIKKLFASGDVVVVKISGERHRLDYAKRACSFHLPGEKYSFEEIKSPILSYFRSSGPVLMFDTKNSLYRFLGKWVKGLYYVDPIENPKAAWRWVDLTNDYLEIESKGNNRDAFKREMSRVQGEALDKCYIFGTGPSLDAARLQDWSDGYRIVCNTIVKDGSLWDHIRPHVIVAGDALYHFGFSEHAIAFRRDLKKRLKEQPAIFIFPAQFEKIVASEFSEFKDLLFPIEVGESTVVHTSIASSYKLPGLGNALLLLLFPVGFSLSKNLYLWGFDGRKKNDRLFWSNAKNQSYPDLIDKLNKEFPAFFEYHVPEHDKEKYIRSVHGDVLKYALEAAEKDGCTITMLHETTNEALSERIPPISSEKKS